MSTIYISEQGASVKKKGEMLVVTFSGNVLFKRHFRNISNVMIIGNIQVTTQVLKVLMVKGISVSYFSLSGQFLGQAVGQKMQNMYVKLAQLSHYKNEELKLNLAKITAQTKIQGQLYVLKIRRHGIKTSTLTEVNDKISEIKDKLVEVSALSSVRGIEGSSAKLYFSVFDTILPADFPFQKRSRRPALNEVNSLLNFSYTLLLNETVGMIESYGLDVMLGFYHSVRYGRVSLGLDVMELFRPLVVDQFVIQILRNRKLVKEDFYFEHEHGVYLTDSGRKKFLLLYRNWTKQMKLQQHLETVVKSLETSYLEGKSDAYQKGTEKVLSHFLRH